MRIVSLAWALALTPALLCAQSGDRPGEHQKPLPSHLKVPPAPALSAEEALKTFNLAPGFHIEIVASDPLLFDPVAMSIDAAGRLWVVEMRAYMPNVEGKGEDAPIGSVAMLEDTDGDGRMDKRTEFAGGFVLPRAIAVVGDGVLVAEPPHLWFLRDTDGDGKADERREIANDYGDKSNPEHTANGLVPMLDNWIYNANLPVRFRFDGGHWSRESTLSRGQWGITQDNAGRIFYNSHSDPLRVDLIPDHYLKRNPNLVRPTSVNVELAKPSDISVWPGRVTPGVNRGYELLRDDGTLPVLTAACGPVIYRGSLFPPEYEGNAFICEPAGNLVKRLILDEQSYGMKARNAYPKSEFLTSTDERFRPVNLYNAPDGSLYIVDMYRGLIQHRIYVTTFLRDQVKERGLETPVGMGRIYRVVPDTASAPSAKISNTSLADAPTETLVERLSNENGWQRDTAQRLLVEHRDPSATPLLKSVVRDGKSALGRLHALWALEGIHGLDRATVEQAAADVDVRVAAAALRLSEPWMANDISGMLPVIQAALKRDIPVLTRQALLSLGAARGPEVDQLLEALAKTHGTEPTLDECLVSGIAGRELDFIERLRANHHAGDRTKGIRKVTATAIAAVLKSGNAANITRAFDWVTSDPKADSWLSDAVLDGIDRFIPEHRNPARRVANVPAEPRALLALAALRNHPQAARVQKLLNALRWPGKAGTVTAVPVQLTPEQLTAFEKGRTNFAICAGCHQKDGQGLSGLAPSLVNSRWVLGPPEALMRIVLQGKEDGGLLMPPLRALDDETLASILTYVRHSWGHQASAVTPDAIAKTRQATQARDRPWSDEELESFESIQEFDPSTTTKR